MFLGLVMFSFESNLYDPYILIYGLYNAQTSYDYLSKFNFSLIVRILLEQYLDDKPQFSLIDLFF
jgi:hypothetical protein